MPFAPEHQKPALASNPEDLIRSLGEGVDLGEPVAGAMFSDRYVDVEHMPREVQSEPWYAEQRRIADRMHREHMARAAGIPPDWVWPIVVALPLAGAGIAFFGVLFLGWWS